MTSIMMNTFKNSQIMILLLIASLLIITPLLSTSLRSKYLYFVINLLIIAVGAEAGLLSFFFKSPENKKPHVLITTELTNINKTELTAQSDNIVITNKTELAAQSDDIVITRTVKVVEKCSSEKILGSPKVLHRVKKSPSMPSIFFIGGCEQNTEAEELFDEGDVEDFNEQELLFQKAEVFIGDFYKQLKMQREESWKKLHGICQKAF